MKRETLRAMEEMEGEREREREDDKQREREKKRRREKKIAAPMRERHATLSSPLLETVNMT